MALLAVLALAAGPARAQQPAGEVQKYSFSSRGIFPGTVRDYWVYVPAQYDGRKPACLYVNQDGLQWNAPAVFDALIAKGEMPVTIGVFVTPGRVPAENGATALDRFNRSLEYDGLGDRYARFLAEELLPDVEKRATKDGRAIRLSKDPNDRAIGGASSGAVCAFTAAWERPDLFRRVFSAIGTYVGLRGADRYPTLVRKTEPKPLRVYLEDGSNDLNIYAGDWWMANQMMERALTFAGYPVEHSWGEGGHNGTHGTQVFPDAMRWLWKDWPKPVAAGPTRNQMLREILKAGEEWEQVQSVRIGWGLATDAAGTAHYFGNTAGTAFQVAPGGKPQEASGGTQGGTQAFGPDGSRYRYDAGKGLTVTSPGGATRTLLKMENISDLVVDSRGRAWIVEQPRDRGGSTIWRVDPDGKKTAVESPRFRAGAITLSPDQSLMYVADPASQWVYSYQVTTDGALTKGQQFYWLHVPDEATGSNAYSLCVDRDGRLYAGTSMGVQVCDQAGRVNCILPLPGAPSAGEIGFGGIGGDTLYVISGSRVFRRKLAVQGRQSWEAPNKPAAPRL
jgi:enterochelin esterase-like enzyme